MALISSAVSSAAFLPMSGSAPAPSHLVIFNPMFIFLLARFVARSCASVLIAINSTPSSHSLTILLIALFPAHPTPITLIFAQGMKSGLTSVITIVLA
jgi:hypothetical protein